MSLDSETPPRTQMQQLLPSTGTGFPAPCPPASQDAGVRLCFRRIIASSVFVLLFPTTESLRSFDSHPHVPSPRGWKSPRWRRPFPLSCLCASKAQRDVARSKRATGPHVQFWVPRGLSLFCLQLTSHWTRSRRTRTRSPSRCRRPPDGVTLRAYFILVLRFEHRCLTFIYLFIYLFIYFDF